MVLAAIIIGLGLSIILSPLFSIVAGIYLWLLLGAWELRDSIMWGARSRDSESYSTSFYATIIIFSAGGILIMIGIIWIWLFGS